MARGRSANRNNDSKMSSKSSSSSKGSAEGAAKKRNPSHAAKNVTALDRVREFGDILMTDDSGLRLVCWACGFYLDHTRRSTIVEHLRSIKHNRSVIIAEAMKNSDAGAAFQSEYPQNLSTADLGEAILLEGKDVTEQLASLFTNPLPNSITKQQEEIVSDFLSSSVMHLSEARLDDGTKKSSDLLGGEGKSGKLDDGFPRTEGLSGLCLVKREVHCYSVLDQLLKDETYTDVTITTNGHSFHAHKIVLCMASSYFRRVLNDNSPGIRNVIVLRDVPHAEMKSILQFLYTGEATVDASDLQSFMKTAQLLEINSLCDRGKKIPIAIPSVNPQPPSVPISTTALATAAQNILKANAKTVPQTSTELIQPSTSQTGKQQNQNNPQQHIQYYLQHLQRQLENMSRPSIQQEETSIDKTRNDFGTPQSCAETNERYGNQRDQQNNFESTSERHDNNLVINVDDSDGGGTYTIEEENTPLTVEDVCIKDEVICTPDRAQHTQNNEDDDQSEEYQDTAASQEIMTCTESNIDGGSEADDELDGSPKAKRLKYAMESE